jgi:diguanylate cyclase
MDFTRQRPAKPQQPNRDVRDTRPAELAKAALRRLVAEKLEPTPENYARAYQQESGGPIAPAAAASATAAASPTVPGVPAAQTDAGAASSPTASQAVAPTTGAAMVTWSERGKKVLERIAARALEGSTTGAQDFVQAVVDGRWETAERLADRPDTTGRQWADLINRIMKGVDRGGRQWTTARKKQSLQRVLDTGRGEANRLLTRLTQLLTNWDADTLDDTIDVDDKPALGADSASSGGAIEVRGGVDTFGGASLRGAGDEGASATMAPSGAHPGWAQAVQALDETVQQALAFDEPNAAALSRGIARTSEFIRSQDAPGGRVRELDALCVDARRVLQHRHHLLGQLGQLCQELTSSLVELSEDDSWVRGQCEAMNNAVADGMNSRGVKSVSETLRSTRVRQSQIRQERAQAREALKSMINIMISELGELGEHTGRFHDNVGRYAEVIEQADSLQSLASVVREMVEETHTVQALVGQARDRIQAEHSKAHQLTERVNTLEGELRRLSEEVSTDQLTKIANRRGLIKAFETELANIARLQASGETDPEASSLCLGLLDIDNFKRLNDELGHSAGDEALRSLADVVSKALRPTDMVARYGGEEFVVMLPRTLLPEGQQILTRLQRSLTGGLFMHEEKKIFVTFSAGVTLLRDGERMEDALERADQALYEAKRTGKNRTCIA